MWYIIVLLLIVVGYFITKTNFYRMTRAVALDEILRDEYKRNGKVAPHISRSVFYKRDPDTFLFHPELTNKEQYDFLIKLGFKPYIEPRNGPGNKN